MTWIKICGTTNVEDALASVEAGANALGFVFAPSPRRVSPREVARITAALPSSVEKIGVFVNQAAELVLDTVDKAGLSGVQLHGEEDVTFCRQILRGAGPRKLRIVKAISMRELEHGKGKGLAAAYEEGAARAFGTLLLDSGGNGQRGGTGAAFDWQAAAPIARLLAKRFALVVAGGLRADNVGKALRIFQAWGVDVVSGVEQAPGKKDKDKLRAFVAAVRQFEAEMPPTRDPAVTRS